MKRQKDKREEEMLSALLAFSSPCSCYRTMDPSIINPTLKFEENIRERESHGNGKAIERQDISFNLSTS